jgi:flagellar M-ring protein FliF
MDYDKYILLKKPFGYISALWSKWSMIRRLILSGIAVVVIAGVVALFGVSSSPSFVPVFSTPISDPVALDNIVRRIEEEGVKPTVSFSGVVKVADESTARRMRAILIREDLVPVVGFDPWAIFDEERMTDFERNVNFHLAQTQMITDHIKALEGIDDAYVIVSGLPRELFREDQPITASVVINPNIGSDITKNRNKIEGIQKLLKYAVDGLKDENILITDYNGNVLNDFSGMKDDTSSDAGVK